MSSSNDAPIGDPNHRAAYRNAKDTKALLGVSTSTLRHWDALGAIDTIRSAGHHRLYNVDKYLVEHGTTATENKEEKESICSAVATPRSSARPETGEKVIYCRVSSPKQKDDLERQVKTLQALYPSHTIIRDIGSGLNFKRKGLQRLLERCLKGEIQECVVAHRDRLCRFGYELLQWLFSKHGVHLIVHDQSTVSVQQELVEDLMAIVHVFSCRLNGKRRYKKTIQGVLPSANERLERDEVHRGEDRGTEDTRAPKRGRKRKASEALHEDAEDRIATHESSADTLLEMDEVCEHHVQPGARRLVDDSQTLD